MDTSLILPLSLALMSGIGIFLVVASISIPTKSLTGRIRDDGAGPHIVGMAESKIFQAFVSGLSKRLRPVSGNLEDLLRRSGWRFESEIYFYARRMLAAFVVMVLCVIVGIALNVIMGLSIGFLPMAVLSCLGALMGFILPDIELNNAIDRRRVRLKKEMGFGLDQIHIYLQSGADLMEALAQVTHMGIFGKACEAIATQASTGEPISTVTENVQKNLPQTPEFDEFLKLIHTGIQKGEAVQEPFRERAASMRQMLVRSIIEEGHKSRIKVTFLTIIFMLVATMIVTIVPITLLLFEGAF
ncbi:MAG: type II secretion system F family protein [Anaerolineales bacterium]|jgi:Flp pilus assembly protein TadB